MVNKRFIRCQIFAFVLPYCGGIVGDLNDPTAVITFLPDQTSSVSNTQIRLCIDIFHDIECIDVRLPLIVFYLVRLPCYYMYIVDIIEMYSFFDDYRENYIR